jgi:hypothetical protein
MRALNLELQIAFESPFLLNSEVSALQSTLEVNIFRKFMLYTLQCCSAHTNFLILEIVFKYTSSKQYAILLDKYRSYMSKNIYEIDFIKKTQPSYHICMDRLDCGIQCPTISVSFLLSIQISKASAIQCNSVITVLLLCMVGSG